MFTFSHSSNKNLNMDTQTKESLAMTKDISAKAAAVRLRAARMLAGLSQDALGRSVGVKKQVISNIESGKSLPSRALMVYLYREHRVDFNFLIHGDFAQLPSDIRDALFDELMIVHSQWDQRED